MKSSIHYFVFIGVLAILSCGKEERDLENYGDLAKKPNGILIDASNHYGGFGRGECLVCHNASLNLHKGPDSNINADELNKLIATQGEAKFCMTCHGKNGTP